MMYIVCSIIFCLSLNNISTRIITLTNSAKGGFSKSVSTFVFDYNKLITVDTFFLMLFAVISFLELIFNTK